MKWTVLSDNRTNDSRLETEHGLSILLETEKHHILLDTGASDVFIRNAEKMGIDLSIVDFVFLSHGHSDHAGGLRYFMGINDKAKVIVSPYALNGKFYSKRRYLHSITTEWPEEMNGRLFLRPVLALASEQVRAGSKRPSAERMADQTCEIDDGLHIIAHIPQIYPMPQGNRHLFIEGDNNYIPDDFRHELALYTEGLLFTGCAHSGLENILAACPYPVNAVVGGFHLLDDHETDDELTNLGQRLKKNYPKTKFYTSHCTGSTAFTILKNAIGDMIQPFACGTNVTTTKCK